MDNEAHGESFNSPKGNLFISSLEKGGAGGELIRVNLSDGSSFFIAREVLLGEGLGRGDELTAECITRLKKRTAVFAAEKKALLFLSRSSHTIRALKVKLIKKGFAEEVISVVLNKLTEEGYLDDRFFAEEWLRLRLLKHPEGRPALLSGLIRRGVPRGIAEKAVMSTFTAETEQECARRFVAKLKRRSDPSPQELSHRLSSRRFRAGIIKELLADSSDR